MNADRLPELEEKEQVSDLSDSTEEQEDRVEEEVQVSEQDDRVEEGVQVSEQDDRVEEGVQVSEQDDRVEEGTIESDLITDQPQLTTVLSDSILENQPSEEITENKDLIEVGSPVTDSDTIIDDHENDITFVTQTRFGLMGTTVEEISGSFSLNLHCLTDHEAANMIILQLNSEGYRVVTQEANVNGIDYLRVGVGQFESRRDARSAAQNLPEQYVRNYFIIQI